MRINWPKKEQGVKIDLLSFAANLFNGVINRVQSDKSKIGSE